MHSSEDLVYFKVFYKFLLVSVIIGFFFILFRWFERKSLYFPIRKIEITPEDVGLSYEDIYFDTDDGLKLHGWFIPSTSKKVLIFCHGNGGNISHRIESILIFNSMGLNVFIFDYRGYGRSPGIATDKGTTLDALAAYKYILKSKTEPGYIILFGKSIGANVAISLASNLNKGILIAESGFTSVMDVARDIYKVRPPDFLIYNKYNSLIKIKDITIPKLIIHSQDDEYIPIKHGMRLFNEAKEPKEFFKIRGGHNEGFLVTGKEYKIRIEEFIDKYIECD